MFEVYADGRAHTRSGGCLLPIMRTTCCPGISLENLKKSIVPVENAREYLKGKSIEKICALDHRSGGISPGAGRTECTAGALPDVLRIPGNVEINEAGTNKGSALAALCETLGIPQEAVMALEMPGTMWRC